MNKLPTNLMSYTHIPVVTTHLDCQLNVAPFYQCCCTCKFRVPAVKRWPWWLYRIIRKLQLTRFSLIRRTGWACVAYDLSHVEINWPEHSCGCELHTVKETTDQIV